MSSATVTDARQADAAGDLGRAPLQAPRVASHAPALHDVAEAALRRRARRQGLLLMIASSAVMIALLVGIVFLFR